MQLPHVKKIRLNNSKIIHSRDETRDELAALCGREPAGRGRWLRAPGRRVTCSECEKIIEKLEEKAEIVMVRTKPADGRPFAAWLDKNCDFKERFIGPEPPHGFGIDRYECDHWYFVIEDHDDGETPAITLKVGHEERSEYMGVEVENRDERGDVEASCFLGLFTRTADLEALAAILTRVNR